MDLSAFARRFPDKIAVVNATSGHRLTYGELDAGSSRFANAMHDLGLRKGDHVAVLLDNHPRYLELVWAAMRSALYVTPMSRFLTRDDVAYMVRDCDAKVVVSSASFSQAVADLAPLIPPDVLCVCLEGEMEGWIPYASLIADQRVEPKFEDWRGDVMYYTSGTTGRPKGVFRPLGDARVSDGHPRLTETMRRYGFDQNAVYLSPAPLYHGAPLGFSLAAQFLGGTVVLMDHFDPEEALEIIERYSVTHSQWVPTMFVRLLKLDEQIRTRFRLSSQRVAIHSAAPCPPEIKRQMIAWWGPILQEYYRATESHGMTEIDSQDWLLHAGSVGRAVLGRLHICSDDGVEVPPGEIGTIYFERESRPFRYYKDDAKTASAVHPRHPGWMTVGDIGYVDGEGYLYLTDRKDFMIISGGVNIYPRMIEDCLMSHPAVADVAVIGVPNADLGEEVKAVVQLVDQTGDTIPVQESLLAFARERLARNLIPRSFDFVAQLPRLPTGKLRKGDLRAAYWPAKDAVK